MGCLLFRLEPLGGIFRCIAIAALILFPSMAPAATLQMQLESAISSFTEGAYTKAYWEFETMEFDFGNEPEYTAELFQKTILPVRAYAAMMADRPTDALVYYNDLLRNYDTSRGLRAFVLYNAAIAQSQTKAHATAAQTFRTFRKTFPGTNEATLALLQEADLLSEIGDYETAFELLSTLYDSDVSSTLRMQGRLRALQIASEIADIDRTKRILFETEWNIENMPDIAVLSFAALETGDLFLSKGYYGDAIKAYRLTFPYSELLEKQKERLRRAQRIYEAERLFASKIWNTYFEQLISRLDRQLKRMEAMADYTPGLYLRFGQTYLLAQRYREATILFKTVARSDQFDPEIRAEAHYRWIVALSQFEEWQKARDVAESFMDLYPGHDLANAAIFLIARSYQAEGRPTLAIAILDQLIANHPQDPMAPQWYFTKGYNYCALEHYEAARTTYAEARQSYPKHSLTAKIELWAALTYFFERDYPTSIEKLNALKEAYKNTPIYPEILYRTANAQYAQRNYEESIKISNSLIKDFPDHARIDETYLLLGDTFMAMGDLDTAISRFRHIRESNTRLHDYAVFQIAKIYKATQNYPALREHLNTYIERDNAAESPRLSEALYLIGWSFHKEGSTEKAFPIFNSALERFGNDRDAVAIDLILNGYAKLYENHRTQSPETAISFETWIHNQKAISLQKEQLTWFSRLTLYTAARKNTSGTPTAGDADLLSIHRTVPIGEQAPESLAAVGLALARRGYSLADDYFEELLNHYPDRTERAAAYYGKALIAVEDMLLMDAKRWLTRFLEETPTHPIAADARLLTAEVLTQQGLYDAAKTVLNEILSIKEMRGRPHARALSSLAEIETALEQPERAIAYWQRIYTLYRAYPEIIVEAYWKSALLFEKLDDPVSARNTINELLRDARLDQFNAYTLALKKRPELERAAQARTELAIESNAAVTHTP